MSYISINDERTAVEFVGAVGTVKVMITMHCCVDARFIIAHELRLSALSWLLAISCSIQQARIHS